MDIAVSARHIELTDPIRAYAEEKAARLPKFFDRVTEINVVVNKADHDNMEVEIVASAEHTDPFVVKVVGPDMYALIDEATDKLERQLRRHKEKLRNRKHNVQ